MSKFYTASTQAKDFCDEAKATKEKSKELNNEVLLKKGEVIRLTEDLNRLQGIKKKLKDEVEELKADSIEKETRTAYLKGKVLGLTSSMEKAQEEAIAAFIRLDKFKNHLDRYYAIGYEDFRANANKTYLKVDFNSFKIPTATKSSLLPTSFKDVNMVDDASTETAQDATNASKDDPKSRCDAPSGLSQ